MQQNQASSQLVHLWTAIPEDSAWGFGGIWNQQIKHVPKAWDKKENGEDNE